MARSELGSIGMDGYGTGVGAGARRSSENPGNKCIGIGLGDAVYGVVSVYSSGHREIEI